MLIYGNEVDGLGRLHNLPFFSEVITQVWKGIVSLRAGRLGEGIPQFRYAIEMWHARGSQATMPYFRSVLAEGVALSGDSTSGLQLIEESLTQLLQPGREERSHLAEILRLKGWMLSLQGHREEAERTYLASLDVAREQQAKSWELRTATSLARLWHQQDKRAEAYKLLSDVYAWFTEGFDTKDLQEAKTLLEDLTRQGNGKKGKLEKKKRLSPARTRLASPALRSRRKSSA